MLLRLCLHFYKSHQQGLRLLFAVLPTLSIAKANLELRTSNIFESSVNPFINRGTCILRSNRNCGSDINENNFKGFAYQDLGFGSAEEMQSAINDSKFAHEHVLQKIDLDTAKLEEVASVLEGFSGPNATIKNGQIVKNTQAKTNPSYAANINLGTDGESLKEQGAFPKPKANTKLAQPLQEPESNFCQGNDCNSSTTLASLGGDYGNSYNSYSGSSGYAGNNNNGASTFNGGGLSHTTGTSTGGSSPRKQANSSTLKQVATEAPDETSLADTGKLEPAAEEAVKDFVQPSLAELKADSKKFQVMPEGWFLDKSIPGMEIRGALDIKYNADNPDDPNNFYQVFVKEKRPGVNLEPGVYTVKKVPGFDDQYALFADMLSNGPIHENNAQAVMSPTAIEFLNKQLPNTSNIATKSESNSTQLMNSLTTKDNLKMGIKDSIQNYTSSKHMHKDYPIRLKNINGSFKDQYNIKSQ